MIDLNRFKARTYSQNGEDGMIAKLFSHLGIEQGTFVEMGAGDGMLISNTRLLRERGWVGALIEGDLVEFAKLTANVKNCYLVNKYVDCSIDNSLDYWLSASTLPVNLDLLSLDIDGNDLWVWKSLEAFVPKAVLVEYNYTLRESLTIEYDTEHRFNNDNYFGATAQALCKLASEKNYLLCGWTDFHNLMFVHRSYAHDLRIYSWQDVPTGGGWPQSKRKMIPY